MTFPQWIEAQATIIALWPHAPKLSAEQIAIQHDILADVPMSSSLAAIRDHAKRGEKFPPTPGEIAAACTDKDTPPWTEAERLIRVAAGAYGRGREAEALTMLADACPEVARFAVEHGWRRLCNEPLDDPSFGGAVRKRLADAYAAVADDYRREISQGRLTPMVANRLRSIGDGSSDGGWRKPHIQLVRGDGDAA